MFKKWGQNENEDAFMTDNTMGKTGEHYLEDVGTQKTVKTKNTILKGNKLIGDISVSCDLELSGEIEGNITSEKNSNIVIKGVCRGNITTLEGSVEILGELHGGNISAGNNISISGKYIGGEVRAQGRIQINGEFNGKMEANEIEIGPEARGAGELFYKEHISIAKGAAIEGQVGKLPAELTLVTSPSEAKKTDKSSSVRKAGRG